jgi:hypothetical protein
MSSCVLSIYFYELREHYKGNARVDKSVTRESIGVLLEVFEDVCHPFAILEEREFDRVREATVSVIA